MNTQDLDRIRFVTRHFNDLQGLGYMVPLGLVQVAGGLTVGMVGFPKLLPLLWLPLALGLGAALFLRFRMAPSYYRSFGQVEQQSLIPLAQWAPLSVFSPAGVPAMETHGQPIPFSIRRVLIPIGLALALVLSLRAIGSRVSLLTDSSTQDPWLQFTPPVVVMMDHFPTVELMDQSSPLMTEMLYAIVGSLFFGMWLWRESRPSQGYLLALALPLLGLPALGLLLGLGASIPPLPLGLLGLPLLALAYMWMAQILCGSAMLLAGLLDHLQLVRTLGRPVTPQMEEPS